jgi:hypothetical protein
LDDVWETRLDVRELSGTIDLDYDLAMKLSYQFWDQGNFYNSQLENYSLQMRKDFSSDVDEQLALGFTIDYAQQDVAVEELDLFQLEERGVDLTLDLEKKLLDRVKLFSNLKYQVYNDYQLASAVLDSNVAYDSNYNYGVKTGLKFEVGPGLQAKLGYRLQQESLQAVDETEVMVSDYDLTEIYQMQHGLFLGLETRF